MKIKKVCIIILSFSLMFFASSCVKENNSAEKSVMEMSDFPARYVCENESIEFDADVIVESDVKNLYKSIAIEVDFKKEKVIPLMFQENIENSSPTLDGNNYVHSNGNSLYIENDYLAFNSNTELEGGITNSFSLFPEQYTADKFDYVEDADVLNSLQEKQRIEKVLYSIGIRNLNFIKAYQLDYQTLQENEQHSDNTGKTIPQVYKDSWSNQDDSTWWIGTEIWQGLPVFCTSFYAGMTETWAPIQVLYTQNGIEKLQVLYYFNFEKESEKITLKSFEEVADALSKKYSLLLTDNGHIVTKAELFFWIDVNQEDVRFEMTPVWVFTLREYKKDLKTDYIEYQELVNAETAETLEVGE